MSINTPLSDDQVAVGLSPFSTEELEVIADAMSPKPIAYYRTPYETSAYASYLLRAKKLLESKDPAVIAVLKRAVARHEHENGDHHG